MSDELKPCLCKIVHCKDCIYWQDRQIKLNDGTYRDYLPTDEYYVSQSVGINIGSHCTLHGHDNDSSSWFWSSGNDYCSRGVYGIAKDIVNPSGTTEDTLDGQEWG